MSIQLVTPKSGYPLEKVTGFPREAIGRLREHSVTTAEEFLGLVRSARGAVATLLDLNPRTLRSLEKTVEEVLPPEEAEEIAREESKPSAHYGLGHDPPESGESTF